MVNNIKQQLDVVKNLYYDVKKLKNNYMFAYYLSRLSEGRKLNNEYFSYKKYFLYSEYITGLTIDISQINWNQKANIIKEDRCYIQLNQRSSMLQHRQSKNN